jgi:peptide chain release factor subunit 1
VIHTALQAPARRYIAGAGFKECARMQSLQDTIDRLAAFEPVELPVVSLYLDLQADQHGKDRYDTFIRKELPARAATYLAHSAERESLERDIERIREYLDAEVRASANGLAIFACSAADDFFETVQLDAPLDGHRLYIYNQPHLFHLARVSDEFPRYAAVVLDTHQARILVFDLGERVWSQTVDNPKPKHHKKGGWSQARYQRHTENIHLQHAKEVVDALARVVREDAIDKIVLAGDEVIIPTLREQLPQELAERIVDVLSLDIRTPEHEVLRTTLESLRQQDEAEDADKVQRLLDAYRAGGLGVVGVRDTLEALTRGQVDELLISTVMEHRRARPGEVDASVLPAASGAEGAATLDPDEVDVSDQLVTQARATGAAVTFIQDASLLDEVGGVGGLLRFKL